MAGVVAAQGPTGIERLVAPEELFFSTTDRRGIIRSGNSVFVRISGFSLEELTGSPHSLVRHPDMPGGAYRLLWDRLLAGRPVGAYVQNLAKDGSHYWVFATVTPLGEGFLSVRMAPRGPLFTPAKQIYTQVRALERDRLEHQGYDRRASADLGAIEIESRLRAVGFDDYDDFVLEALPAEVAARAHLVTSVYARRWADGPIGEVLAGATTLDHLLDEQVQRLEGYRVLSQQLADAAARVLELARRLDQAVSAAQHASVAVKDSAPVLLNVANVMGAPMHTAVAALEQLSPRLRRLRSDVGALRLRIALASLHNDMVAAFGAEVADGLAPGSSLREVPLLCDALHDGVLEMTATAGKVNAELAQVAELVAEAVERLEDFRRFLGQWRILVMRHRAGAALSELLPPIDEQIAAGHGWIDQMKTLGQQCRAARVPVEAAALEVQVARIRTAAAQA